jgi:uncharacterized membrane protein
VRNRAAVTASYDHVARAGLMGPPRHRSARAEEREQGAVMVFTALALAVLLFAMGLTLDVGNLDQHKRFMQSVADMAALDARPAIGQTNALSLAQTYAGESATNNGASPGDLTVSLGDVVPETGAYPGVNGPVNVFCQYFPAPASNPPACSGPNAPAVPTTEAGATAVQVIARQDVGLTIFPGTGSVAGVAVAIGSNDLGGVGVGSGLIGLDSANSPLLNDVFSGLLGVNPPLTLTAASYQGLATDTVSLGQLQQALNLATPNEVLAQNLTYGQLLQAIATALQNNASDPAAQANLSVLDSLISANPQIDNIDLNLGKLLAVDAPTSQAAGAASFNIFSLLTGAAQIANGTNAVAVPSTSLNLPNILGITGGQILGTSLYTIQAPQSYFGPIGGSASTGQVGLYVDLKLPINLVGLGSITVSLPLSFEGVMGTSKLTGLQCLGTMPNVSVGNVDELVSASAATVNLGQSFGSSPTSGATLANISLLGIPVASIQGTGQVAVLNGIPGTAETFPPTSPDFADTFAGYPSRPTVTLTNAASSGFDPQLTNSNLTVDVLGVLPISVGTLLSELLAALNPIVTSLYQNFVTPIFNELGIQFSSVTAGALETPNYQTNPVLCASQASGGLAM